MSGYRVPSINIADIDLQKCYFNPGCALAVHKPASGQELLALLGKHFGPVRLHTRCCHHDPGLPAGAVIINNCAGCDRRFRTLYAGIQTLSLWEILDSIQGLPLPDHSGLTVSVHDPCSFRPKPQVHAAVRRLLRKMQVDIVESDYSKTRSICCGDNFYPALPIAAVEALQKERAAQMPCQDVAVYCVGCMKSMAAGGKTPRYMVDLILGEDTDPQQTRLDIYHDALNRYIETH